MDIAIEAVNTESVNNPWAHKRLREDVGDPRITVGLDITNMVHPGVAFRMTELINTTFDLLGDQIRYVHAKDFVWNTMLPGINWAMNGTGNMDYEMFLVRLSRLKTNPYVLVEFLTENQEYAQAQRNIRAIADKVGVKIVGHPIRRSGMKTFLLTMAVLLLPAMSFGEPNFSGTWVRDGAKSDVVPNTMYWLTRGVDAGGGRGRNAQTVIDVQQSAGRMRVTDPATPCCAPWCSTASRTRCRRTPESRRPPSWRRCRERR